MEPAAIREAIERFIQNAKKPALVEAGEDSIALDPGNFALEYHGAALMLQAWNDQRNLVRRITGIESESRGRLDLRIEKFGKKPGKLQLLDLERGGRERVELHSARLEFRERLRRFLRRHFPTHKIVELSTEANLEESLSPAYARALIREGTGGWAVIGAAQESVNVDGVLSFGLIWLDYLRRGRDLTVHGLVLLLPAGQEKTTCLRLRYLNPEVAQYRAFAFTEDGLECPLDLADYGNLDTHLEPVRRRIPVPVDGQIARLVANNPIEAIPLPSGELSLRVNGWELARTNGSELLTASETNGKIRASNVEEVEALAKHLASVRSPQSTDPNHFLFREQRELWLESRVRSHLEQIDARLLPSPVYEQAPTFVAAERGIIDLLAVQRDGRLTIVELKAAQDIHLPLQGLDYWIRVKWHLDHGEFGPAGYFPEVHIRPEPPRMMFVAPALDFHPSNECVLRYFSPEIEVERIGVGADWQRELKIMFRM